MEAYLKPLGVILEENPDLVKRDDGRYISEKDSIRINEEMIKLFEKFAMSELFKFRKCFSSHYDYQMEGYGSWYYCKEWLVNPVSTEPIKYPESQKFDPVELEDV